MEENFNNEPQKEVEKSVVIEENKQQSTNDEEPLVKESKMKGLKIAIGVVVVLVVAAVGAFFYFKSQRTAPKFIDTKIKEVTKSLEESLTSNTAKAIGTLDITNAEIVSNGNFKVTASGNMFEELNNTEISYNFAESVNKEYLGAKLNLKSSDETINGGIYLDGEMMYFDLDNVLEKPVKYNIQENIFKTIKEELSTVNLDEYKDILDINNIKDFSIKTINFIGESLKETINKTSSKGLNVEYEFVLDGDTLNKVKDKFISLAKSDVKYSDFIKKLTGETDLFSDVKDIEKTDDKVIIKVEVNVFTNKLENLTITVNDKTILSKVAKNQYKFLYDNNNEKNYALLTIKDDEFKIATYANGKESFSIELLSKKNEDNINISISQIGGYINTKIKKINDSEEKITIDANLIAATIKADVTTKVTNNKISANGTIDVKVLGILAGGSSESIKLDFTINFENGQNIVTKDLPTNAINVEDMDPEQLEHFKAIVGSLLGNFVPTDNELFEYGAMQNIGKNTFVLDAQTAVEAANTYFMNQSLTTGKGFPSKNNETNCVSIEELEDEEYFDSWNGYKGKIIVSKVNNGYSFKIWLADDNYMIIDKSEDNGITENDVKNYSSDWYYEFETCQANEKLS